MNVQIDATTFALLLIVVPEIAFIGGYIIATELFIKRVERTFGKKWTEIKAEWKSKIGK